MKITDLEGMSPGPSHTRRARRLLGLGTSSLAVGTCVLWALPAAAENTLGVALNYNDAMDQPTAEGGAGIDVHFGPRMDLAVLVLTTELSLGFHDFGGDLQPAVYRGLAGGRVGVGLGIRPSVFAHLGVGHLRYDDLAGTGRDSRTHLAGDLGAALDFTILPLVDLGVQGAYNFVSAPDEEDAFEWLQLGAHVTFIFDAG